MKYRIGNRVINSDQIVQAHYWPAHDGTQSQCDITLTSIIALELDQAASSDTAILHNAEADAFWQAYSGDAYTVVA